VERIVGLEGVRTTPAFLQRHGHARLELIRLHSPVYEGRLPVRAREPPCIRPFPPSPSRTSTRSPPARGAEFVGELDRYHDSYSGRGCGR
jgi:hypothetical protein